jgi:hypothetical protein
MQTPGGRGHAGRVTRPRIKKPIAGRPGIGAQFQLWIFSYTNLPLRSKKRLSRLMIGFGGKLQTLAAHTRKASITARKPADMCFRLG